MTDSFKRIGSANVTTMKALVDRLTEASWTQDSIDAFGSSPNGSAQVILLVHDDRMRHDKPTRQPALEVFSQSIRPVLALTADHFDASPQGKSLVEQYGAGYFVRARLVRVLGGGTFAAAPDRSISETHSHRIHVPLISNDDVRFRVGDRALVIPEGEIYEINNLLPRDIANGGDVACVHLILDYVLDREPAG